MSIAAEHRYPALPASALDAIAQAVAKGNLPGYPPARLHSPHPLLFMRAGRLHVPGGDWLTVNHPNRAGVNPGLLDPEAPQDTSWLSAGRQQSWQALGLTQDQYGRPIHPYWRQLLADPRIGLPTGLGMFYRYGPNQIVDAVVYRRAANGRLQFLLVQHRQTRQWGLPGGFIDPADASPKLAASREVLEETGIDLRGSNTETLQTALPLRRRDTLHAWLENTIFLIHGDQSYLAHTTPIAGDDAAAAGWFTKAQLARLDLADTHWGYLSRALTSLAKRSL